jgi:RND family efflux transporter MFP subunit
MQVIIALTCLALLGGCEQKMERTDVVRGRGPKSEAVPSMIVRASTVEAEPHIAVEEVVGTVNPKLWAIIEAKISGRIEKMLAVPGQRVRAGEPLVQLDAREVQARLDQATAIYDQAQIDLKRYAELIAKRAVPQQEFDAVESRARVARASLVEAGAMLSYATITAPFDGVVTRKLVDIGDLATPGKALLAIEDSSALRFEATVPEATIGRVALGAGLRVQVGSSEIEGTVAEIAPSADPTTRTFLVKLDLPSQAGLRGGQFGRVRIPVSETSVLRVPVSAVVQRGQMELVFIVAGDGAQLRLVRTGKRMGDEIEVISGIDAGELVVTEGAATLIDGQPITVRQPVEVKQ